MKKILVVHEKADFQGGAEQNIYDLACALEKTYSLDYLSIDPIKDIKAPFLSPYQKADQFKAPGPDRLPLSGYDLIFLHKCLDISLLSVLTASGIPLLHMVHDHESYCLRKSRLFPLTDTICQSRAPFCCLFPGLSFFQRDPEGRIRLQWKSPCEQIKRVGLEKKAGRLLVASNFMKQCLIQQGFSPDKISCQFGIRSEEYPSKIAVEREKGSLLFTGQIVRGKGLHSLIAALGRVKPFWRLTVIGSGPDLQRCQELAVKLRIDGSIAFKGFLPHREVLEYYRRAMIGIVPSIWPEPFGMVGPEMLLNGLPVIAYDSGGIGEWLRDGKGGFLVPRMNEEALAEKITESLKKPGRMGEMGECGKKWIKEQYDFEEYVKRVEEIIERL